MPTLKFFVSLFLSCVFVFVQISPGLGLGLGNMCFDCSKWLSNCQIEKGLLVAFAEEDNSILVDAGPDESPDSALENCLLPGKKITGGLVSVVCSAAKSGSCGVIGNKQLESWHKIYCSLCAKKCGCTFSAAPPISKGSGKLILFLGVFHIMLYKSLSSYQ